MSPASGGLAAGAVNTPVLKSGDNVIIFDLIIFVKRYGNKNKPKSVNHVQLNSN